VINNVAPWNLNHTIPLNIFEIVRQMTKMRNTPGMTPGMTPGIASIISHKLTLKFLKLVNFRKNANFKI
jgi:hypothetical protein